MEALEIRIGTAGWNIPKNHAAAFPQGGTHLARYARRLNAVEINSSFYRPHRPATYQRWAASVPPSFRFAVKMPRSITHDARLAGCEAPLKRFLEEVAGLGEKLGVILIQLPPKAAFDAAIAADFFAQVKAQSSAPLALEPRHPGWFTQEAQMLLRKAQIARVAADPPRAQGDGVPGGWQKLVYYRLHGSPRLYYSDYDAAALALLRASLAQQRRAGAQVWCIFDNTAAFAATGNALTLADRK